MVPKARNQGDENIWRRQLSFGFVIGNDPLSCSQRFRQINLGKSACGPQRKQTLTEKLLGGFFAGMSRAIVRGILWLS